MIVKRIEVSNVGPFLGDWEVELREGVNVFVAEYEGAGERSNRAGKSWLAADAQFYALFGSFRGRGVDDLPHRLARGRESAYVEGEYVSSDGRDWLIRRGRTAGGDPIRLLNGSRVSDEDLKRVVREEVLGLSEEEYRLTAAAEQGEMHGFLRLSPAEKRRLVSPWFKTDRWVPRSDLARARLARARLELSNLEDRALELAGVREGRGDAELRLGFAERDAKIWGDRVSEAFRAREETKARLEREVERRRERRELEREVERLEAEVTRERIESSGALDEAALALEDANREVEVAVARRDRLRDLEAKEAALAELFGAVGEFAGKVAELRGELRRETRARAELLEKFRELKASRTGACPVLGEPCDRVVPDEGVLEEMKTRGLGHRRAALRLEREVEEAEFALNNARSDVDLAREEIEGIQELRDAVGVEEALRELERAKAGKARAERALERSKLGRTEAGKALARARKKLEELPADVGADPEEALAEAAEALALAEEGKTEAEGRLAAAKAEVAGFEKGERELVRIRSDRELLKGKIENLAWAAYAFGAAGIPSRELENAFGLAEDAMNRALEDLRTPLRLRFAPTRELKDWEPACLGCGTTFEKGERTHLCRLCGAPRRRRRRDELRLEVEDGGNASSFELDSGGGKVLLSLGVRLGLLSLPGATRAVRCEHLLVDEPDGALDGPNREALHALLRRGVEAAGVRQVLLVTHADARREFGNAVVVHRWEAEDRSGAWNE